jgi:RHS repeat-associated protein
VVGVESVFPTTPLFPGSVGEEFDPDLGLINLRARQYSPGTGRLLTLDFMMGKRDRPVTMNRYLYASSDPVRFSDPTGLTEFAENDGRTSVRLVGVVGSSPEL